MSQHTIVPYFPRNTEVPTYSNVMVGDRFILSDGSCKKEICIIGVFSKSVAYQLVADASIDTFILDRAKFDTCIKDGSISNQRAETLLEKAKRLIDQYCISEFQSRAEFDDMEKIPAGFTTITDYEIPIQIYINLTDNSIERELDGVFLDREHYSSLEEMINDALENMEFANMIDVSDAVLIAMGQVPEDYSSWVS